MSKVDEGKSENQAKKPRSVPPKICGIKSEDDLLSSMHEFAPDFVPILDERVIDMSRLMDKSKKIPFIPGLCIDNVLELLRFVHYNTVGAIVCGHKMSGKSQTLEFLRQYLKTTGSFVLRLSMKPEGQTAPQADLGSLFESLSPFLERGLAVCRGILDAQSASPLDWNSLETSTGLPVGGNFDHLQSRKPDVERSSAELAFKTILDLHKLFLEGDNPTDSRFLVALRRVMLLMSRPDCNESFPPSFILLDEIGELINPTTIYRPRSEVSEVLLTFVRRLFETAAFNNARLFVVIAGSTSVASFVETHHLQKFRYHLKVLNAARCDAFVSLWGESLVAKLKASFADAVKWLEDVTPSGVGVATNPLGEGLLKKTDGVPGYLVELLREAVGKPSPDHMTLEVAIGRCYDNLKALLGLVNPGADTAIEVKKLLEKSRWEKLAQVGLCPSAVEPPSFAVFGYLLTLLRDDLATKDLDGYLSLLRTLARLRLTGSFEGAVYQEQVLVALLAGKSICGREVSCVSKIWRFSESRKVLGLRAQLITYKKETSFYLSEPVQFGPAHVGGVTSASTTPNPNVWLYVPESQTFPSIDLTVAHKTSESAVTLYHCSISVDAQHFASSLNSASGHLPLQIEADPPTMLRSAKAAKQVGQYRDVVSRHGWLQGKTLTHKYGLFDDMAKDLLSPTPPFCNSFWVFST